MSNADRQKRYRAKQRNAQTVTRVPDRNAPIVTPQDAPQSTNADKRVVERGQIEVGQRTRTVAIPGDADYVGCCKLVDGDWQVDSTKPDVKSMDTDELVRRLHYIHDWQQSPEHKEVMRRRETAGACL